MDKFSVLIIQRAVLMLGIQAEIGRVGMVHRSEGDPEEVAEAHADAVPVQADQADVAGVHPPKDQGIHPVKGLVAGGKGASTRQDVLPPVPVECTLCHPRRQERSVLRPSVGRWSRWVHGEAPRSCT